MVSPHIALHKTNTAIVLNCSIPIIVVCLVKGNQKGKVTCYARERVNKNELF